MFFVVFFLLLKRVKICTYLCANEQNLEWVSIASYSKSVVYKLKKKHL